MLSYFERLQFFVRHAIRQRQNARTLVQLYYWLRYFPDWQKSLDSTPVADSRPWLVYDAIKSLDRIAWDKLRICEYGVGGSTLYFAQRAAQLISIEHNEHWADELKSRMENSALADWKLHVIPPRANKESHGWNPGDPDAYVSGMPEYTGQSFKEYVCAIDNYPDDYFDLVQVDGRSRPGCVKHAAPKVKPGGWIVLDDSERERYRDAHSRLAQLGWHKHLFFGPVPYFRGFQATCIWRRPLQ